MRSGQPPVHREFRDQRVKIPTRVYAVLLEVVVQPIPVHWVGRFDEHGEIREIRASFAGIGKASDTFNRCKPLAVAAIDIAAAGDGSVDVFELQQAECRVEFAHLAVDARGHDRDLVYEAEILQVVDALLGLRIGADDGSAFKGVKDFGGVKAQN